MMCYIGRLMDEIGSCMPQKRGGGILNTNDNVGTKPIITFVVFVQLFR